MTATRPELLRAVADLIEAHPDMPAPHVGWDGELTWYTAYSATEVAQVMRAVGGRWDKNDPTASEHDSAFAIFTTTLLGYKAEIIAYRGAVCTRKVVGTRTVVKTVPVTTEDVEVTEDIVEWECRPVLAAAVKS